MIVDDYAAAGTADQAFISSFIPWLFPCNDVSLDPVCGTSRPRNRDNVGMRQTVSVAIKAAITLVVL